MLARMKLGVYRHFSGGLYRVTSVGHDVRGDGSTEVPGEEVVIYQALFTSETFGPQHWWVRSVRNFSEEVELDGRRLPRFKFVENDD